MLELIAHWRLRWSLNVRLYFYKHATPLESIKSKVLSCPEMSLHKSKHNGKDNY